MILRNFTALLFYLIAVPVFSGKEITGMLFPLTCTITLSSADDVSCNGLTDGEATLSVSGFTNPDYYWINSAGDTAGNAASVFNLAADNYSVTVSDSFCTETIIVTINEPAALQLSAATTSASCYSASDGDIDLTVSGGTIPYAFSWSNGSVTEDLSAVSAGTYTVIVSDTNNCTDTLAAAVSEPAPSFLVGSLSVGVTCNGLSDGYINLTISGSSAYSYLWSDSSVTEDISGLAAGNYTVTVTDISGGCSQTHTYTINEPPVVGSSAVITNETNGNDGAIDLTVTGGNPSYMFDWSYDGTGDNDDTEDLFFLPGGIYTVIITDQNGCTDSLETEVLSSLYLDENYGSRFLVYPNPVNGVLFIQVPSAKKVIVKEISGRVVKIVSHAGKIDTGDLPAGIYVIEVETPEGFFTKKIIKIPD